MKKQKHFLRCAANFFSLKISVLYAHKCWKPLLKRVSWGGGGGRLKQKFPFHLCLTHRQISHAKFLFLALSRSGNCSILRIVWAASGGCHRQALHLLHPRPHQEHRHLHRQSHGPDQTIRIINLELNQSRCNIIINNIFKIYLFYNLQNISINTSMKTKWRHKTRLGNYFCPRATLSL